MSILKLDGICKSYKSSNGERKQVISDFSFEVKTPKFYTIVGPNGCGKTTMLNIIAKTTVPDSGTVLYPSSPNGKLKIGYIWQDYRASLFPWLTVGENITFPLKVKRVPRKKRDQTAQKLLNEFGINLNIHDHTYQLSGGQQQIVNILRNMVISPELLLLDEPFSALDQYNRWALAFKFESIWRKLNVPVFFVSHDVDEAVLLADEILLLNKTGNIEKVLCNNEPRPRKVEMLSSANHNACRKEVIEFLFEKGAFNDIRPN